MRLTMIGIAGAALALGACGSQGTDGNVAADPGMTAEAITANDVTAIDAVTGDAANMAADVDYSNFVAENKGDSAKSRPTGATRKPSTPAADSPAEPEPAAPDDQPANTTE